MGQSSSFERITLFFQSFNLVAYIGSMKQWCLGLDVPICIQRTLSSSFHARKFPGNCHENCK